MDKWVKCPRCRNDFVKRGFEDHNKLLRAVKVGRKDVVEWLEQQDDVMTFINMHCEEKYEAQKKIWLK